MVESRLGRGAGRRVRPSTVFAGVAGAGLAALAILAACSKSDSAPDKSCTGQGSAALSFSGGFNDGYCASNPSANCVTGTALLAKHLVLTFDDGPGSQTLVLSSYLKSKGIRATFFVNGHCFGPNVASFAQCQQNPAATPADIFPQILADGHIVQNHTTTHRDLSSTSVFPPGAAGDTAIVKELTDTDTLVAPYVTAKRFLFRAPYGAWSARDYTVLHASAMDKYVGPVKWDIGGAMFGADAAAPTSTAADWDCWQNVDGFGVKTTKECGDRYFHEITAIGRGIVLMHDADYGDVTNHNLVSGKGNTIDMVKYLLEGSGSVTGLLAQGYSFQRLDEVPDIAALLPPLPPDAGTDAASDAANDGGSSSSSSSSSSSTSSSASSSSGGSSGASSGTTPPSTSSGTDPCPP